VLALVLPLGSCVTGNDGPPVAKTPPGPPSMERVVNTGYSLIANRYVEPVENKSLSLHALRGLNNLDPAIEIDELANTKIAVRMGSKQLGAWDAPKADDVRGWARLTFNGTGVRWIGLKDAWSGIARVSIDGTLSRRGLDAKVPAASEVHFLPVFGGG